MSNCQNTIIISTCAANLSVEFFLFVLIKQQAGNIMQMATPIVEPTNPMISSIDGIKMPMMSATNTIEIVMYLKRCSGI